MRLATIRRATTTVAARIDSVREGAATAVPIPGFASVGELLSEPSWAATAAAPGIAEAASNPLEIRPGDLAPVIPRPGKIICVGLNYADHIEEMGHGYPDYPTLFVKFADALTGPFDDVSVPTWGNRALDWEGELAVIIGKRARRVDNSRAAEHIAGYAVMNDYTQRDLQYRTLQWHQGKNLEGSAGFGPWLTTGDSWHPGGQLTATLNGETMQSAATDNLVFSPEALISYISHIYPLDPGDVIATGTPNGVGHAREPQRYLDDGDVVRVSIEGLGYIENRTLFEDN